MPSNRRATIFGNNNWYMIDYPDKKGPVVHLINCQVFLIQLYLMHKAMLLLLFLNAIFIVIINCQVLLSVKPLLNVYAVKVDLFLVAIAVLTAINALSLLIFSR